MKQRIPDEKFIDLCLKAREYIETKGKCTFVQIREMLGLSRINTLEILKRIQKEGYVSSDKSTDGHKIYVHKNFNLYEIG